MDIHEESVGWGMKKPGEVPEPVIDQRAHALQEVVEDDLSAEMDTSVVWQNFYTTTPRLSS